MATFVGVVKKSDLEGGIWQLHAEDGEVCIEFEADADEECGVDEFDGVGGSMGEGC